MIKAVAEIKNVISFFLDYYICIFSTNQCSTKSTKSNVTHQFAKYTCRYINPLLVTVSATVRINFVLPCFSTFSIGLVPLQFLKIINSTIAKFCIVAAKKLVWLKWELEIPQDQQ